MNGRWRRERPVRRGLRLVAGVWLALALASACGSSSGAEDPAPGATRTGQVTLVDTRPQVVGPASVVAYNIRGKGEDLSAMVSVVAATASATGSPGQGGRVGVGDQVTIGGQSWDVVQIVASDDDAQPGGGTGYVVIAPR